MFGLLFLAMAAQASQPPATETQMHQLEVQGPMPAENMYLRPGHKGSDDRMFPDIAIGELRVEGDTLYVRVLNKGQSATPGAVLVAARAAENGSKTDMVEQRITRLQPGEARWVPLRGFSVKTAAMSPAVFALESASAVSAVARMIPTSTGVLDRSGQTREMDTIDLDESNNGLTATASQLKRGRPL
jgi:hypothetical protein